MAVSVYENAGNDISASGEPGDLACTTAFPAQPVMFWPPGLSGLEKYRKSYFDVFGPKTWHHGDFVCLNPETGGVVMLDRSDGVLKPPGVRFGSAEICNVLLKHFADEIEDFLCMGRRRDGIDSDETVVLFVNLALGLSVEVPELVACIQGIIRKELSPRHVSGIIDVRPEIPVTSNVKKVENAVKQILCGLITKIGASVADASCLDWCRYWALEHS